MKGCHYSLVVQAVQRSAPGDQLLPAGQGIALLYQGCIRGRHLGFSAGNELAGIFRDPVGDFRSGGTGVGGVEFETGIFQGVMAGGEVYGKGSL